MTRDPLEVAGPPGGKVIDWLLDGDPAVRWQVRRDLLGEPAREWRTEQSRVATRGWGKRLLAAQSPSGRWTRGLYSPKWTSTTYTLALLRRLGLPRDNAQAVAGTDILLRERVWEFGRNPPRPETCVAGITLATAGWFDADAGAQEELLAYVLAEQMADGGWNCRRATGATHASFHTTINVLEGLREIASAPRSEERLGASTLRRIADAEAAGREFFLRHHLYRSHRTGAVVDARMARLPFPPRWHHDNLRTLDYFRAAGAARDARLADPVEQLLRRRRPDGRWPLQHGYPGQTWFDMEETRTPSRWNTLRAARVLAWWRS